MDIRNKTVVFFIFFSIVSFTSFAQSREEKKQLKKEKRLQSIKVINKFLEKDTIVFVADRCYPSGWSSVDLIQHDNYLRIYKDSTSGDLPYFGTAYRVTPNERGGIYFDAIADTLYSEDLKKKGMVFLKFKVSGEKDNYSCSLLITDDGSADLTVVSNNYQIISYSGDITNWETND